MDNEQTDIEVTAADSFPFTKTMELNSLLTRRQMLGITGMAGLATLTGMAANAAPEPAQKRPRIALSR